MSTSRSCATAIFCCSETASTVLRRSRYFAAISNLISSEAAVIRRSYSSASSRVLPSRNMRTSRTDSWYSSVVPAPRLEVRAHTVAQVLRLADVYDLPRVVLVQIDAGAGGQIFKFLFERQRNAPLCSLRAASAFAEQFSAHASARGNTTEANE